MVVLEEGLPAVSQDKLWLPAETQPTGASMKCPQLDMILVFDSARLCLDQNPADVPSPFQQIAKYVFDTLISKFDIKSIKRLGARKVFLIPVDSVDAADKLSVQKASGYDWSEAISEDMSVKKCEAKTVLESDDGLNGVNFSVMPAYKIEAPEQIDPRLNMASHLLPTAQKDVLLDQLKRRKQREDDPVAGLRVDIDCWSIDSPEVDIPKFLQMAEGQTHSLLKSLLEYRK